MSRFQVFLKVLFYHALVLGMIVLLPFLKSCEWFPKKEQIITVDLASLPPPPPPVEDPPVEEDDPQEEAISEATPEPAPTPTATPLPAPTATPEAAATPVPTATPSPTATPKPTPTPKSALLTPEQIREQRNIDQNPSSPVAVATLSPAQIQKMLSQGLPTGGGGSGTAIGPVNGGAGVNMGGVSSELRNRLYTAWQQPVHLSGNAGIRAIASVKVMRSGQIGTARILRGSGNTEFDTSVEKALSAVKFAKALPDGYVGDACTFEIEFNLTQ